MGQMVRRACVYYSGHVQGVYFRSASRTVAVRLGLYGYAKNLDDGRVEVIAERPEEKLNEMLIGISEARRNYISGRDVSWEAASGEFKGFEIR